MSAKTVQEYEFCWISDFTVQMPLGARVLSAHGHPGTMRIWALVDCDAPTEKRRFLLAGTKQRIERADGLSYVATIQTCDEDIVLHLFERVDVTASSPTTTR